MSPKRRIPTRVAVWGLIRALTLVSQPAAQNVEVRVDLVLSIGDSDDATEDYLFAGPHDIAVDSRGNLYVADGRERSVRMYDRDGVFVRRLGEGGAAPGEFRDISGLAVNPADELVVFDRWNDRATRFSNEGELIDTHPLNLGVDIWDAESLDDGSYVVSYFSYGSDSKGREDGNHVLHVMNNDFSATTQSIVRKTDLYEAYEDIPYVSRMWFRAGRFRYAVKTSGDILVTPYWYDGVHYVFKVEDGYSTRRVFSRRDVGESAVEAIDESLKESYEDRGFNAKSFSSSSDGRHAALVRRQSRGEIFLSDGTLLHFYSPSCQE